MVDWERKLLTKLSLLWNSMNSWFFAYCAVNPSCKKKVFAYFFQNTCFRDYVYIHFIEFQGQNKIKSFLKAQNLSFFLIWKEAQETGRKLWISSDADGVLGRKRWKREKEKDAWEEQKLKNILFFCFYNAGRA